MARPSEYDPDVASALLFEIATSREGLNTICSSKEEFPDPKTVYRWMLANEEFRQGYARAKEDQLQVLEDEILGIADTPSTGAFDNVERSKLRIESRKWLMGKLKPKKYGDKSQVEHSGEVAVKRVVSDL